MRTFAALFFRRARAGALAAGLLAAVPAFTLGAQAFEGPKNATVLILRHAEKPESGRGLTSAGEARAQAYARYFRKLSIGGEAFTPNRLIATADSAKSARPRLTLGPLARTLALPVNTQFRNEDVGGLASTLAQSGNGRSILIAWHHGRIPKLISALGGDPRAILPGGKWPDAVYDWVVMLKFDAAGALVHSRLIHQPALR